MNVGRRAIALAAAVASLLTCTATSVSAQPRVDLDMSPAQWHLRAIGAPSAWLESTGAGVTVAVVDSGVDSLHQDLAGALTDTAIIAYGRDMRTAPVVDQADVVGHGTHVAALIAARSDGSGVTGVAPNSTILPAKIIPDEDYGQEVDWESRMAELLTAVAAKGAKVVNMSFGGTIYMTDNPAEHPMCKGIAAASNLDLVLVAAAGNEGYAENEVAVPAACPGVLSVGATDYRGEPAYFSTFNAAVDISAPGLDVLSAMPAQLGSYAEMSGTSMASPIVAGVAALVRAKYPNLTAGQVVDRMLTTAHDVYAPGVDTLTGAGLVDAAAALGLAPTVERPAALGLYVTEGGIRWKPPHLQVTSYRLTVTDTSESRVSLDLSLPPTSVSWPMTESAGDPGDYVTLEATFADGSTAREYLLPFGTLDPGPSPAVTDLKVRPGDGGLLRATWKNSPTTHSVIVALLVDNVVRHVDRLSRETHSPLPEHYLLPLRRDPHRDYRIAVVASGSTMDQPITEVTLPALKPVSWRVRWFNDSGLVTGHLAAGLADQYFHERITVKITHLDGSVTTVRVSPEAIDYGGAVVRLAARPGDRIRIVGVPGTYLARHL